MPFDIKKFRKVEFTDRVEDYPLRYFQEGWFPEGETPQFKLKGLNGIESAKVEEASSRYSRMSSVAKALAEVTSNDDITKAFSDLLEGDGAKPNEVYARMAETLRFGVIEPDFNFEDALKFLFNFPIDAKGVFNKISSLSGKGRLPGESKPSGKGKTSKQA